MYDPIFVMFLIKVINYASCRIPKNSNFHNCFSMNCTANFTSWRLWSIHNLLITTCILNIFINAKFTGIIPQPFIVHHLIMVWSHFKPTFCSLFHSFTHVLSHYQCPPCVRTCMCMYIHYFLANLRQAQQAQRGTKVTNNKSQTICFRVTFTSSLWPTFILICKSVLEGYFMTLMCALNMGYMFSWALQCLIWIPP